MQRQQALAEQKRLEQEREERERKRAMNEIQQIKDRHLKEKIQQISSTQGQKFLQKIIKDVRCFFVLFTAYVFCLVYNSFFLFNFLGCF